MRYVHTLARVSQPQPQHAAIQYVKRCTWICSHGIHKIIQVNVVTVAFVPVYFPSHNITSDIRLNMSSYYVSIHRIREVYLVFFQSTAAVAAPHVAPAWLVALAMYI